MQNLPVSRLIDVQVDLAPLAAQAQDLSTLLVLGSSTVIDVVERLRTYNDLSSVADDFGTSADEYLAAVAYFGQSPQPQRMMIGRWALADTNAKLIGAPLSIGNSVIAAWTSINNGSMHVTVDGVVKSLTSLDFSGQTSLNGVAGVIDTALTGATVVYNSIYNRFEFISATSGASSTMSFVTAGTGGTDISAMVASRSTDSGAYIANGIVAETALVAAALFDSKYGQNWYALMIIGASDSDHQAVGSFIEASNNKHLYGVNTQEGGVLSSVSTSDIAYLLDALNLKRTVVQYSSASKFAICSLLGRALTVNYNGNNTTITLMYKQEPGITAESLTSSQVDALETKDCNVFVEYNNSTSIIEPGKVASGDFLDTITGTDWLAVTIMTAIYNLLYTSPTKIPQTDAGMHLLTTTIESVCSQAVQNGLLGAGVWNSNGFGTLRSGDFMPKGFYVYAPPVASQLQADREARKSVPIQVAAKLAGAVHTVDVLINVNR